MEIFRQLSRPPAVRRSLCAVRLMASFVIPRLLPDWIVVCPRMAVSSCPQSMEKKYKFFNPHFQNFIKQSLCVLFMCVSELLHYAAAEPIWLKIVPWIYLKVIGIGYFDSPLMVQNFAPIRGSGVRISWTLFVQVHLNRQFTLIRQWTKLFKYRQKALHSFWVHTHFRLYSHTFFWVSLHIVMESAIDRSVGRS